MLALDLLVLLPSELEWVKLHWRRTQLHAYCLINRMICSVKR